MTKRKPFPSLIHVTWDAGDDEPYLLAHTDGVASLEGGAVGVYQLVDDGRAVVERRYISRRRKGKKR